MAAEVPSEIGNRAPNPAATSNGRGRFESNERGGPGVFRHAQIFRYRLESSGVQQLPISMGNAKSG